MENFLQNLANVATKNQSQALPIEKIIEIDLERNNPGVDYTPNQVIQMVNKVAKDGWKTKRFGNTLLIYKDQNGHIEYHSMTADKPDQLVRAALAFYSFLFKQGNKQAVTYFDNPKLISLFDQLSGTTKVSRSGGNDSGKYKAVTDLQKAENFRKHISGSK